MVLTGYNTDIEHGGTTYHVQTEDKGRSNPVVESLVYARGEILYSRRTSYQDLVDQNVDSDAIATLMERQHHTISEAIRRGRLESLGDESIEAGDDDDTSISRDREEGVPPDGEIAEDKGEPTLDQVILDYLAGPERSAPTSCSGRAPKHKFVLRPGGRYVWMCRRRIPRTKQAIRSERQGSRCCSNPRRNPGVWCSPRARPTTRGRIFSGRGARCPILSGGTSAVVIIGESDLGQSEMKYIVHR